MKRTVVIRQWLDISYVSGNSNSLFLVGQLIEPSFFYGVFPNKYQTSYLGEELRQGGFMP